MSPRKKDWMYIRKDGGREESLGTSEREWKLRRLVQDMAYMMTEQKESITALRKGI